MSLVALFSWHLLKLHFVKVLSDNEKYREKNIVLHALIWISKNEYPFLHVFASSYPFPAYFVTVASDVNKNSVSGMTLSL